MGLHTKNPRRVVWILILMFILAFFHTPFAIIAIFYYFYYLFLRSWEGRVGFTFIGGPIKTFFIGVPFSRVWGGYYLLIKIFTGGVINTGGYGRRIVA